ncbi:hypothetical protein WBJ53_29280 [Spirosoma sp. SC4-14]|uniref:hypothetical protein n=1 Tax=Spirosoma sp. SC4-14 TaxID=3128900 RepID=UPI0030D447CA
MKPDLCLFLAINSFSAPFADIVRSRPTGEPTLDYALLAGGLAIVILLVVRMIRKRKQM